LGKTNEGGGCESLPTHTSSPTAGKRIETGNGNPFQEWGGKEVQRGKKKRESGEKKQKWGGTNSSTETRGFMSSDTGELSGS